MTVLPRDAFVRNALWLLSACIIIAADLFHLAAAPGGAVPAFQHDWIWPVVRDQCVPLAVTGFEPWHGEGLGISAAYPESYIYHALAGTSCVVFGPKWGLLALLFAALLLAAAGMLALYRAILARENMPFDPFVAIALSALVAANPAVLNKMQAGHLKFIIGFAALPWIAALSMTNRRASVFAIGALLGVATMEPQFFVFGLLVIAAFQSYGGTFRFRVFAGAAVIAVAMNLTLIAPAFAAASPASFGTLQPVLFWQQAQSGTVGEALRLFGYTAHYAERQLPAWVIDLYWIVPACVLLALARFRPRYAALFVLATVGILVTAGWNTVFAPLWTYGYEHIAALALFRELYNAIALTVIAYAACAAIGIGFLANRSMVAARGVSVALFVLAFATAIGCTAGIPVFGAAQAASAMDGIQTLPGHTRFAAVPGTPPLTDGTPGGAGYSPWSFSFADHPAFFSPVPGSVELYANGLLRDGSPQAEQWLQRAGVGAAYYLPGWSTRVLADTEPQTGNAERAYVRDYTVRRSGAMPIADASLVAVEQFSAAPGSLADVYSGARDISALSGGHAIGLQTFASDISPRTGWARTVLLPIMPTWTFAQPPALFTLRNAAELRMPAGLLVAGDASGNLHSNACIALRRLDAHFRAFSCTSNPVLHGRAPIVVSFARSGARLAAAIPVQGASGTAAVLSYYPWRITARITAKRGSAIVLRESYDDGWTISIPGARHVRVDGYANAWIVPETFRGAITFAYRPATMFFVCLALSFATIVFCLAAMYRLRAVA